MNSKAVVFVCDGIVDGIFSNDPTLDLTVVSFDKDMDDIDALHKDFGACCLSLQQLPDKIHHPAQGNPLDASAEAVIPHDRLIDILTSYICNDLEAADPGYVKDVLCDRCGCTGDEIAILGLSEYFGGH